MDRPASLRLYWLPVQLASYPIANGSPRCNLCEKLTLSVVRYHVTQTPDHHFRRPNSPRDTSETNQFFYYSSHVQYMLTSNVAFITCNGFFKAYPRIKKTRLFYTSYIHCRYVRLRRNEMISSTALFLETFLNGHNVGLLTTDYSNSRTMYTRVN